MNPFVELIGPWVSEEELKRFDGGVEPNQYHRWKNVLE